MTNDRDKKENPLARSSSEETQAETRPPAPAVPIDEERIAALIDGRLSVDERTALLAELDASPEAFEVYVDAVAALRDIEAESPPSVGGGSGSVEKPPRPLRAYAPAIALALAAVFVIGVALPVARRTRGSQLAEPHALAVSLQPNYDARAVSQRTPWSELRGSSDALSARTRAVRIGARTLDLELLIRARDTSATRVALQVASLLDGIPAGGVAATAYRSLANQGAGGVRDDALREASSFAERVAGVNEVRAGAWMEAARVAAAQRDDSFFQSSRAGDARRAISSLPDLPPTVQSALADLARLLAASPRDWPAIESTLSALLQEAATG